MQNGAPFDLFFSADIEYPKKLEAAGLAEPGTLYEYAVGRIVISDACDSNRVFHTVGTSCWHRRRPNHDPPTAYSYRVLARESRRLQLFRILNVREKNRSKGAPFLHLRENNFRSIRKSHLLSFPDCFSNVSVNSSDRKLQVAAAAMRISFPWARTS